MDNLPDLDDIFISHQANDDTAAKVKNIELQISKGNDQWIDAEFIDTAIGGIGIHILLPIQIELTAAELNKVKLRFIRRNQETKKIEVVKQFPVMVRWQETDTLTGYLKMGIHFGSEYEGDLQVKDLVKQLKKQKNG